MGAKLCHKYTNSCLGVFSSKGQISISVCFENLWSCMCTTLVFEWPPAASRSPQGQSPNLRPSGLSPNPLGQSQSPSPVGHSPSLIPNPAGMSQSLSPSHTKVRVSPGSVWTQEQHRKVFFLNTCGRDKHLHRNISLVAHHVLLKRPYFLKLLSC